MHRLERASRAQGVRSGVLSRVLSRILSRVLSRVPGVLSSFSQGTQEKLGLLSGVLTRVLLGYSVSTHTGPDLPVHVHRLELARLEGRALVRVERQEAEPLVPRL